ncbi:hypothetical protein FS837_002199 [Tulasnella sp. UAMH 9824]|nr:hypothetical protein FS837_002199 [Tulasnella sp. UAMH 9824]
MPAQLPTELKIKIVEHVDRSSLPAVIRTNSNFRFLESVMECSRTMVARPSRAAAVRTLRVSLGGSRLYWNHVVQELLETMREALMKLENLRTLELPGWDDTDRPVAEQLPRGSPLRSLQHYYGPAEVIDNIQSSALAMYRDATGAEY